VGLPDRIPQSPPQRRRNNRPADVSQGAERISYLPQEPSVFRQLTSEENLLAVLETLPLTPEQQRDRLEELLVQMGLDAVRTSKAYMLSGGERRRLEIARSLTLQPSFVLLDEPFSGIDPLTVKDLQEIIRDLGKVRHRGSHHGPQRSRDLDRNRPRVHSERWKNLSEGTARRTEQRRRSAPRLSGDHFRLN